MVGRSRPAGRLASIEPGHVDAGYQLAISTPSGSILFTLDGSDPRADGGGVSSKAQNYSTPFEIQTNVHIFARAYLEGAWSPPRKGVFFTGLPALTISEVMYHPEAPEPGSEFKREEFEFVELKNVGTETINLQGVRIRGGVDFVFTNGWIAPGEHAVIVKNANAFRARYGAEIPIAGEYSGYLANEGEKLQLAGPVGEKIMEVKYQEHSFPICDGLGFSLVQSSNSWRPSALPGGSPGADDPEPEPATIVKVNEFSPSRGLVELLGPEGTDLSGWFLTTNFTNPKQIQLPLGAAIPATGFLVLSLPELSGSSGEIYLFAADSQGRLTGYVHGWRFGAVPPDSTVGLQTTSDGQEFSELQSMPTFGAANSGPEASPLLITEIMYHPPDVFINGAYWDNTEREYIEIFNRSDEPIAFSEQPWELRGAANFAFPSNLVLNPKSYLLIVAFDPANSANELTSFRREYALSNESAVLGLYLPGKLPNSEGLIELVQWRDLLPVVVDTAYYSDAVPRLSSADGLGNSLQRRSLTGAGRDLASWISAPPSPGVEFTARGDADADGIPDEWENQYGLDPSDPTDAALDSDHDGSTNLQEYLAGTNPRDPSSYLRIDRFSASGLVRIEFTAIANKTYSIQFTDDFQSRFWKTLTDVPAEPVTRTIQITDPVAVGQRFYRIVTPQVRVPQ